ncbi:MAG: protein translocase subunit SecF [Deltaproteobacteria bacterium]|jgi:preprotein translocase subunit SecF|nr:MAG: protein translocase subunit SecF [Deltaproteobacteria bacterium]
MLEIIKNTNIDFMRLRKYTFAFSGSVILFGLYAIFQIYTGGANLGIDLAGGTALQVRFEQQVQMEQVRQVLTDGGFPEATLQSVPRENIFIIKVSGKGEEEKMVGQKVVGLLEQGLPSDPHTVESIAEIGPAIGKKLRKDAIFALAISALAIIVYLAWRFEFKFGVAAALATFHDVIMLVAIFFLLGREMDLLFITALLTIGGYSLTDTVVVFDRIRENIRLRKRGTFSETINLSVNEVLSRTVITSITTFMACIALLVFGGVVLKDFSLALALGIIIGTYSSVFVASPIVAMWRGEKMVQVRR